MDQKKPERKTTEIVPVSPGSSQITRRGQTWFDRDIDSIFDDFRRSFDLLMRPYFPLEMHLMEPAALPIRYVPVDIIDEGDHYVVHAELPGFTKEDVEVQIDNNAVMIRAKKEMEKKEERKNYLHRERAYSAFERSFSFPEEVNPAKTEGEMKEGVLMLKVPKKEPKPEMKPRKIELK